MVSLFLCQSVTVRFLKLLQCIAPLDWYFLFPSISSDFICRFCIPQNMVRNSFFFFFYMLIMIQFSIFRLVRRHIRAVVVYQIQSSSETTDTSATKRYNRYHSPKLICFEFCLTHCRIVWFYIPIYYYFFVFFL